jgi:hypothetical protein
MRYSDALEHDDEWFRRLTGIKKSTFQEMLLILTEAHSRKKARGGRPNKLQISEMLMTSLEYLREYRTYFHIGVSCGLSGSNAYETIRLVEDTLIRSGAFTLPGKKALVRETPGIEVVILVDTTETPVERPKKSKDGTIRAKRRGTR